MAPTIANRPVVTRTHTFASSASTRVSKSRIMSELIKLYETQYDAWARKQVELLKARRFSDLDIEHLVEELEDMGRNLLVSNRFCPSSPMKPILTQGTWPPRKLVYPSTSSRWIARLVNGRSWMTSFSPKRKIRAESQDKQTSPEPLFTRSPRSLPR